MMKYPAVWNALPVLLLLIALTSLTSDADAANLCSSWNRKKCKSDEILCDNGEKCISRKLYCDGVSHCEDRSDEMHCRRRLKRSDYLFPSKFPENSQVVNWVNNQRNVVSSIEKWGSNVDKLILTEYFAIDNEYDASRSWMNDERTYELSIQLLSQLSSKKLEDIPSTQLASYVNAFLVTCVNPRKFHGHDIVKELRTRADQENYTNPYVFLALCNAGENITELDKSKLIDTFEKKHRTLWTDMQAVVIMALACANKQSGTEVDSEMLGYMVQKLKEQQFSNGTVVNFLTTALVMQALISVDSERDPDNFNELKAYQSLKGNQKSDGSFGDLTNTFFMTPILTCRSLADVTSSHCQYGSTDENSAVEHLSRRKGPKMRVQYSLWIGNNKDVERNLILQVPQNLSLYSVMEIGADVDSRFKFEYSVKDRKPYITAISGMRDNPLTGKFWFLYFIQNGKPTLSRESPADIVPKDNDHFVMWHRKGTWTD